MIYEKAGGYTAAQISHPSLYVVATSSIPEATDIRSVIRDAAIIHGVDPDLMVRIAKCESGLKPEAKNKYSTASGVFQYLTSTFEYQSQKYGLTGNKNDPHVQSELTAKIISDGGLKHWSESRNCWDII